VAAPGRIIYFAARQAKGALVLPEGSPLEMDGHLPVDRTNVTLTLKVKDS
jgi:hypothetical protein